MINREKLEEALKRCEDQGYGEGVCLGDIDAFVEAAREYAKILPHLEKMIEARKLAVDLNDEPIYSSDENTERFLNTAANEISAIMKEIGDE